MRRKWTNSRGSVFGTCDWGRAARYGIGTADRRCRKSAAVRVQRGCWTYEYCEAHARAVALVAPAGWQFAWPLLAHYNGTVCAVRRARAASLRAMRHEARTLRGI